MKMKKHVYQIFIAINVKKQLKFDSLIKYEEHFLERRNIHVV